MPMPIFSSRPLPFLTGVLLVVAAILSGCASKNPLMSEPAAKPKAAPVATTDTSAKAAPAAPAAPTAEEAKPAPVEPPKPAPVAAPKPVTDETPAPKTAPAAPAAVPTTPPKAAPAPAGASAATLNTPPPSRTQRWLGIFTPYKQDIQQGNFISHEMAAQIKEGMTKEQVRFLLGVPLLTDMFHDGRWDYLFRLQKANGQVTTNRLTIFFKDNRVTRFESTQLPGEVEYISHISGTPPAPPKEAPKAAPEAKPETKP